MTKKRNPLPEIFKEAWDEKTEHGDFHADVLTDEVAATMVAGDFEMTDADYVLTPDEQAIVDQATGKSLPPPPATP